MDAVRGIVILPFDDPGILVVAADVGHDPAGQVVHGSEDATMDQVPFDLGEPELDLIKPGGVGGREMEVNVGTILQELLNGPGLMDRQIVQDDMDLPALGLFGEEVGQEGDELLRSVACGGLAVDLPRLGIESGKKGEGSMAYILEPMALGPTRREGQDGVLAVQGLDGRFLIHTEDRSMLGRMQVETDDIGGLGLEVGIIGRHVAIHAVRLDPVLLPNPGHHHVMDSEFLAQPTGAPVRGAIGGLLPGVVQNPGLHAGGENGHGPSLVARVQSREPLFQEPLLPLADKGLGTIHLLGDLPVGGSLGKEEKHSRDAGVLGPTSPAPYPSLEFVALCFSQLDGLGLHAHQYNTKRLYVTVH